MSDDSSGKLFDPNSLNRSPHQTFPRSTFEPDPGDPDLLPKPDKVRPSKERIPFGPDTEFAGGTTAGVLKADGPGPFPADLFSADDIAGLPWVRKRGEEWTTADFRAVVRGWLSRFIAARSALRIVGWQVVERANGERMGQHRLPADQHFLIFRVTRRVTRSRTDVDVVAELAVTFARSQRTSALALAMLDGIVSTSLDAQLVAIT